MALISVSVQHDGDAELPYPRLSSYTTRALSAVGAVPVLAPSASAEALAERTDALLLTGGGDLCPACYPYRGTDVRGADHARDLYEYALFHAFLARGKPVFGICRGMQLISVWLGGTLWEDLAAECGTLLHDNGRRHDVETEAGSWTARLLGERLAVTSFHHQACRTLAPGLSACAHAPDGVCEAFCHDRLPIWGVQWHPERMFIPGERDDGGMRRLFSFWNEEAEKNREKTKIQS